MRKLFSGLLMGSIIGAGSLALAQTPAAPPAATPVPGPGRGQPLPQPPAIPSDPAVQDYLAKLKAYEKADIGRRMILQARNLYNDEGTQVLGNPNGDVTIVEFFDYNCPFSRRVEPRVQALLKSDPNVRLILKEFTIEPTISSPIAGRAALAAVRQGKYQAYHDAMLAVTGRFMTEADVFDYAAKVGLDVERLKKDMEDPVLYNQLIENMNLARALRIFQTPTFIVNGQVVTTPSAEIDFPKLVAEVRASKPN